MLEAGLTGRVEKVVAFADTAAAVRSGSIPVFSTPMLVALMESAACMAVEEHLPKGTTTVGISINVAHTAATPIGMKVYAVAKLVEFDGKGILFDIEAFDEAGQIGRATHKRFAVVEERFLDKINQKIQGVIRSR